VASEAEAPINNPARGMNSISRWPSKQEPSKHKLLAWGFVSATIMSIFEHQGSKPDATSYICSPNPMKIGDLFSR